MGGSKGEVGGDVLVVVGLPHHHGAVVGGLGGGHGGDLGHDGRDGGESGHLELYGFRG